MSNFERYAWTILALILIIFGVASFFLPFWQAAYVYLTDVFQSSKNIGILGDFIGGFAGTLIATAGVILLFLTYRSQQSELNATKAIFQQQQFENNFYELLKLHLNKVDQINQIRSWQGEYGFEKLKEEFERIYSIVSLRNVEKLANNKILEGLGLKEEYDELTRIQISYLILYYGIDKGITQLNEALSRIGVDERIQNQIVEKFYERRRLIFERRKSDEREKLRLKYTYGGHQHNLSSYLRNLFKIFTFIENNSIFKNKTSYNYDYNFSGSQKKIKRKFYFDIVRAQMSIFELSVLFATSLTNLGKFYEWEYRNDDPKSEVNSLITDYEFFKYLNTGFLAGINNKKYYPGIDYDQDGDVYFWTLEFKNLPPEEQNLNSLSIARSRWNR